MKIFVSLSRATPRIVNEVKGLSIREAPELWCADCAITKTYKLTYFTDKFHCCLVKLDRIAKS